MWLKIYVLTLCSIISAHGQQSVQLEPFQAMFTRAEGSTLQVNCTSRNPVEWVSDPPSAMQPNAVKGSTSPLNENIGTLMLVNISRSNEGIYFCKNTKNNDQVSFKLKVFSVTIRNSTFEYKVDTVLECSVDKPGTIFTYSWKKGDVPVSEIPLEAKQGFVDHKNGTLEILHPARRFAGLYTCIAEYEEEQQTYTIPMDVPYYATPKVLPFEKSKNLVQDEKLVVECEVLGYPKPYIIWMKGNQIIQTGGDSRYKLSKADTYDGQSMENGRLEIESVDFDDAGEYKCVARQQQWENFNSTQPILVRVKDKLAALWPFLGIVAEVIILCLIIFIYEKKRNKDAMVDEEDDNDAATAEKTSENVRHRGNTNNPRA